jgi:hypothetical protein
MSGNSIEPQPVIDLVERYVTKELGDFEKYTNRTAFDSSGVWELHELARDVYALGIKDGAAQEAARARGERQRERDAKAREAAQG